MSIVYVLCTLALGLFISTISDTQQQAMMTATFFFLMPMIYLSGFIFPIENMPRVIQLVTYLIPLRYFLVIVRGIFLKGIGLDLLWPQALALASWGAGGAAARGDRAAASAQREADARRARPASASRYGTITNASPSFAAWALMAATVAGHEPAGFGFEAGELLLLLVQHLHHAGGRRRLGFDRPHQQRRHPGVEPRAAAHRQDVVARPRPSDCGSAPRSHRPSCTACVDASSREATGASLAARRAPSRAPAAARGSSAAG